MSSETARLQTDEWPWRQMLADPRRVLYKRKQVSPAFTLCLAYYPPGYSMNPHHHDRNLFTLLVAGSLRESAGKDDFDLFRPQVVMRKHSFRHSIAVGPGGALMFTVEEAPGRGDGDIFAMVEALGPRPCSLLPATPDAQQLFVAFCADSGDLDQLADLTIDAVSAAAEADTRRASSNPGSRWLTELCEHICASPEIPSTTDLAERLGVSTVCLARRFRRHCGMSLREYRSLTKLARLSGGVTSSQAPLSEVAFAAGYADQSHMTRRMKENIGVTPALLRKAMRNSSYF